MKSVSWDGENVSTKLRHSCTMVSISVPLPGRLLTVVRCLSHFIRLSRSIVLIPGLLGLNRLPLSFHPLVDGVTTMNRTIERVKYSPSSCKKKVTLQSRNSYSETLQNSTHDYAVLAVPFSILKKWRIDGERVPR